MTVDQIRKFTVAKANEATPERAQYVAIITLLGEIAAQLSHLNETVVTTK